MASARYVIRNTLLLSALAMIVVSVENAGASMCVEPKITLKEAYEGASSIIIGMVTACSDSGCSFDSLEVLKTSEPVRDYRGSANFSTCGWSFRQGDQYLLFLDEKNNPMPLSGGLQDVRASIRMNYLEILREYRDGIASDLSEPWEFKNHEDYGTCAVNQSVGSNRVSFSLRKADTPETRSWTREDIDGATVMRRTTDMITVEARAPVSLPADLLDLLTLSISLNETTTTPVRQATISVGNKSWPLYRAEITVSINNAPAHMFVTYQAHGPIAQQILLAISKPSEITVTAVLVDSETTEPTMAAGAGLIEPSVFTDDITALSSARSQDRQTEPVLRLDTSSTYLLKVLDDYKACVGA